MTAVAATCRKIPAKAYQTGSSTGGALYDCQGKASALSVYGSRS